MSNNYAFIKEKISSVGLGCGIHPNRSKEESNNFFSKLNILVDYALDNGISLLDTAPVYGDGKSEIEIGRSIKNKRSKAFVATKIPPLNTSYKEVILSCENSLKRLNTDYIDLFQIHWPNPLIDLEETMEAMEKLVLDGKIKYIGIGNLSLDDIKKCQRHLNNNFLATIQTEYNLFDRSIEDSILPHAIDNNIRILAYSPLSQGKIANGSIQLGVINKISIKYNSTPTQIVLNYLSKKNNVITIPNTSNIQKLRENIESLNLKISNEDTKKINDECITLTKYINPKEINISDKFGKKVYESIEEAKANKLKLSPSPLELSQDMKLGNFLKPIRLIATPQGEKKYDLIEGRLRFWAWVIAFGWGKKIPSRIWLE